LVDWKVNWTDADQTVTSLNYVSAAHL